MEDKNGCGLPGRRTVLKSVSSTLTVGAFSGLSSAETSSNPRYDQSLIDESLSYAKETLEILTNVGLLNEPTLNSFSTEKHVSLGEQYRSGTGTTVRVNESDVSDRVQTSTLVDGGVIELHVELETMNSYAIYKREDTGSRYLISPELNGDLIEITDDTGLQQAANCTDEVCAVTGECLREVERCILGFCWTDPQCTCGC